MATYFATTRSNYFRVKDETAFRAWLASRGLDCWASERQPGRLAISGPEHGWPTSVYDAAYDLDIGIDFTAELASHLYPGDIAVLLEVGSEKLRYLVGEAIAVSADARTVHLSLDDIYEKAAAAFPGKTVNSAMY